MDRDPADEPARTRQRLPPHRPPAPKATTSSSSHHTRLLPLKKSPSSRTRSIPTFTTPKHTVSRTSSFLQSFVELLSPNALYEAPTLDQRRLVRRALRQHCRDFHYKRRHHDGFQVVAPKIIGPTTMASSYNCRARGILSNHIHGVLGSGTAGLAPAGLWRVSHLQMWSHACQRHHMKIITTTTPVPSGSWIYAGHVFVTIQRRFRVVPS